MIQWRFWVIIGVVMMLAACAPTTTETITVFEGATLPTRQPIAIAADIESNTLSAAYPLPITDTATVDEPLRGTLDAENYAQLYTLNGRAGDLISIEMTARGTLDTALIIVAPNGRELARNDDQSSTSRNAKLTVELPDDGTYTVVATRYRGQFDNTEGDYTLNITEANITDNFTNETDPISCDTTRSGRIDSRLPMQPYSFYGEAGTVVTIDMRADDDLLDPSLRLTDNLGTEIAINEDANTVTDFDAAIVDAVLPTNGYYTIVATRYNINNNSGEYTLQLNCDNTQILADGERLAYLDMVQSRTLVTNETLLMTGYYVGDLTLFDDASELETEVQAQTILTYYLPHIADDTNITRATLNLSQCEIVGLGWDAVAEIFVYVENVGRLSGLTPFQFGEDAIEVARLSECETIDVTDAVQYAHTNGADRIQLRMIPLSEPLTNENDDAVVLLDPRLSVVVDG